MCVKVDMDKLVLLHLWTLCPQVGREKNTVGYLADKEWERQKKLLSLYMCSRRFG